MRVLINHLTRMRPGFVCAAGVAMEIGKHIRPVLPGGQQLERRLLESEGGPFALGTVLDLGSLQPRPVVPEVEDSIFEPGKVGKVRTVDSEEFLAALESMSASSLRDIFGSDLSSVRRTSASVPEGLGRGSLGIIGPVDRVKLRVNHEFDSVIRCSFVDPDLGWLSLKVADIRLWKPDHTTPVEKNVKAISKRLEGSYVAVGLGRAWSPDGSRPRQHWLQVNNIFPVDDPLWSRS